MKKLIKKIINESTSDDHLNNALSDLKFLLDNNLLNLEKYPDLNYIIVNELVEILPQYNEIIIIDAIIKLDHGVIYKIGDNVLYRYNDEPHNINGPAVIYNDGSKSWDINGKEVAAYRNNRLHVVNKPLWNKYFAKNYKP